MPNEDDPKTTIENVEGDVNAAPDPAPEAPAEGAPDGDESATEDGPEE